MRPLLALAMLLCSAAAQDYRDWNSLGRLRPGDKVLVTLDQKHPVFAESRRYTPEELVTGTLDARKPDVVAVERYRQGVWGRGTRAAVFGAVGFGVGFGLGAVAGGCTAPGIISICPGRGNTRRVRCSAAPSARCGRIARWKRSIRSGRQDAMCPVALATFLVFSPPLAAGLEPREVREQAPNYRIQIQYPEMAQAPRFNTAVHQIVDPLVSNFRNELRVSEVEGAGGELQGSFTATTLKSGTVSVLLEWSAYYPGAAHPGGAMASVNYDVRTGRVLALQDLFRPGADYVSRVSQIAVARLEQQDFADRNTVHKGAGPDAANFKVFTLTDTELVLHFQPYQVAAGAAGPQTVAIPLAALAPLLRK